MMRIIVLHGMENTGKSYTLNLLYSMIVPALAKSHSNRQSLGNPAQHDFSEIIIYHSQTVEFFTMGDYPTQLEGAILNASSRGIDILICACSKFSPTLITTLQHYRTTFICKTVSVINNQQLVFNTADAQTLLNMI